MSFPVLAVAAAAVAELHEHTMWRLNYYGCEIDQPGPTRNLYVRFADGSGDARPPYGLLAASDVERVVA